MTTSTGGFDPFPSWATKEQRDAVLAKHYALAGPLFNELRKRDLLHSTALAEAWSRIDLALFSHLVVEECGK